MEWMDAIYLHSLRIVAQDWGSWKQVIMHTLDRYLHAFGPRINHEDD